MFNKSRLKTEFAKMKQNIVAAPKHMSCSHRSKKLRREETRNLKATAPKA
jgi:hypothetical protein